MAALIRKLMAPQPRRRPRKRPRRSARQPIGTPLPGKPKPMRPKFAEPARPKVRRPAFVYRTRVATYHARHDGRRWQIQRHEGV
jgi:hypothetical protein